MAESSITVPEPDEGPAIATDLVDEKHHQYVKIGGGGVGVVNELHVEATGRLVPGVLTVGMFGAATPGPATAYDAGDSIGDPVYLGRWQSGIYDAAGVNFLDLAAGDPQAFDVLLIGVASTPDGDPPGTIPSPPADGDPVSGLGAALVSSQVFQSSDAGVNPYLSSVAQIVYEGTGRRLVVNDGAAPVDSAEVLVDMYAVFVATTSIAAGDAAPAFAGVLTLTPASPLSTSYAP